MDELELCTEAGEDQSCCQPWTLFPGSQDIVLTYFLMGWLVFGMIYSCLAWAYYRFVGKLEPANVHSEGNENSRKMERQRGTKIEIDPMDGRSKTAQYSRSVQNGSGGSKLIPDSGFAHMSRGFGLQPQEQASLVFGDDSDDEDITAKELRKLQNTVEFAKWCSERKMTKSKLQDIFKRDFLYKTLREIHPQSFWQLCRPDTLIAIETKEPGIIEHLVEYIISRGIDVAVIVGTVKLFLTVQQLTHLHLAAFALIVWWFCVRHWVQGRPSSGRMVSALYETLHADEEGADIMATSGVLRVGAASLLEDFFVLGTAGVGIFASVYLRCFSKHHQSVGEMISGCRLVIERRIRLDSVT